LELDYVGVIIGPDLLVRNGVVVTDACKRSNGDSSIKGYKKLFKQDPESARAKADLIIKNTYRTLMTRGMKGCYVFSCDPETNEYLKAVGVGGLLPVFDEVVEKKPLPFRILSDEERLASSNAVPMFEPVVAAGGFSAEQWTDGATWVELPEHLAARKGFFIAQVVGESMNRRIPNGSWCLFKESPVGSRNGKVVLVECRDVQEPDAGKFTVKIYKSEKVADGDEWSHKQIFLMPDSNSPAFQAIPLEEDASEELRVIGEFVAVVG
jgi:SOS-response transcriptional repressor LexA